MNSAVASIYVVRVGDTVPKLAQQFYGDAGKASLIAQANNVAVNTVLPYGQRLQIPADPDALQEVQVTARPSTLPDTYTELPEQTVVATIMPWYKNWKILTGIALGAGLLFYLSQTQGKRK